VLRLKDGRLQREGGPPCDERRWTKGRGDGPMSPKKRRKKGEDSCSIQKDFTLTAREETFERECRILDGGRFGSSRRTVEGGECTQEREGRGGKASPGMWPGRK